MTPHFIDSGGLQSRERAGRGIGLCRTGHTGPVRMACLQPPSPVSALEEKLRMRLGTHGGGCQNQLGSVPSRLLR